jgi:hypothetical protein
VVLMFYGLGGQPGKWAMKTTQDFSPEYAFHQRRQPQGNEAGCLRGRQIFDGSTTTTTGSSTRMPNDVGLSLRPVYVAQRSAVIVKGLNSVLKEIQVW